MFNIVKQLFEWSGSLYSINRTIKEQTINSGSVQEYKEFIHADTVLKKNEMYYFINKIEEAQIIEEGEVGIKEKI